MYNALTPLFDHVTSNDLFTDFKSEKLGVDTDGPRTARTCRSPASRSCATASTSRMSTPRPGGRHRDGRLDPRRGPRAAARTGPLQLPRRGIDAPGLSAIGLTAGLQTFKPSAQTEAFVSTETKALKRAGQGGQGGAARHRHLRRGHQRLSGRNPLDQRSLDPQRRLRRQRPEGPVPRPGRRREAQNSEFLNGLQQQLGRGRGFQAFNDFRQFKNPKSVTSHQRDVPVRAHPEEAPGQRGPGQQQLHAHARRAGERRPQVRPRRSRSRPATS